MNEHPRTLLDDLDEAPVGAAPVGHLLTGGQAAKRRKQRAFVAGAAAVTALVVGGSALALQGIPGSNDDRDSNDPLIADSAAPDLAVEVEVGVAKPLAALIDGQDGQVAIWNPGHRTLAFVPAMGYSSSCPPLGTANFTDSGAVTLTVRNDPAAPRHCTTDDQPVTVTIDGLTTAPPELTVTISGETDTIPVKSPTDDQAPDPENTEPALPQETSSQNLGIEEGDWELLRPDGFLELQLGMSQEQAGQTGRISLGETANGCTGFYLAMYGDGSGLGPHGYFSAERGLAVIHAQGWMHTPEGIALGSSMTKLKRVYPDLRQSQGLMMVSASEDADYFFLGREGVVNYFGLTLRDDPCLAVAFD